MAEKVKEVKVETKSVNKFAEMEKTLLAKGFKLNRKKLYTRVLNKNGKTVAILQSVKKQIGLGIHSADVEKYKKDIAYSGSRTWHNQLKGTFSEQVTLLAKMAK